MSATFSKPVNRLAWRAGNKGVSRDEAITRALANVETIREQSLVELDDHIEILMKGLVGSVTPDPLIVRSCYESSNAIAGTAGVFGYPDLGKAAYSLCGMIHYFEGASTWNKAAIKAHLDAIEILRRRPPYMHEDEALDLIQGLSMMTSYIQSAK